jgi:hypothetical protein
MTAPLYNEPRTGDAAQLAAGPVESSTDGLDTRDTLRAELAKAHEQIAHLRIALDTSRDIGAATGILMARLGYTREQAFDALRMASNRGNLKLRDIALEVLDTGELPEPTPRALHPAGSPRRPTGQR